MKSLERQLQVNLASSLTLVMLLIWLIGLSLPRPLPNTLCLEQEITEITAAAIALDRPQRFRWLFPILAMGGISTVLLLQTWVIRRTFHQLDGIRDELKQLAEGHIQQLNDSVPAEVQPIVLEVNYLSALMRERLERSRHALGNLAHALKGPLNLLTQYLDHAAPFSQTQPAQLQVERVQQLIERELKRARVAGLGKTTQRFEPQVELPTLLTVLAQLNATTPREVKLRIDPTIQRFGDREDMLELFGNLLDNAYKWAKSNVYCYVDAKPAQIQIVVEDDGAGCSDQELASLSQRGVRLDESVSGHGLGLAICQDIAKLYGGTLSLTQATSGGLKVTVLLPLV